MDTKDIAALPSFHVVNTLRAQLAACSATATSTRTAARIGHHQFMWEGDQLHVVVQFGRYVYAKPVTEEQAIALARNHAHVKGRRAARGTMDIWVVMGSGR